VTTLRETILKNSWQEDMVGPHLVRVDDAIDALRQWLADQGLVVVPMEVTDEMLMSGIESDAIQHPWEALDVWRRMIAAAPDALRAEGE
jgi:hypothetical protein